MTDMEHTAAGVVADLVSAGLLERTRAEEAERVVARTLAGNTARDVPAAVPPPASTPAAPTTVARPGTRNLLVEIAGYVGAALVLTALALFVAQYWADFSDAGRVVTLASTAVLLLAAGLVLARVGSGPAALRDGRDDVRRRLTSAVLTAAALAGALTVGLQLSLLVDDPGSGWPGFAGASAMVLLTIIGYRYVPSGLATAAIAVAGVTAVMNGWSAVDERQRSAVGPAVAMIVFGVLWLLVAERGWFRERVTGRALGMGIVLFGAQLPLSDGDHSNVAYAFTFAVAVAGFAMYVRTVSWPYLLGGVAAVTLVVPEAVIDWTGGALGPAGGVLVAGLTLLGASVAGFRLRQEAGEPEVEDRADVPVR